MLQLFGIGLIAFGLYFVQRAVYRRMWDRGLKAALDFGTEGVFEGERGTLKELVENRKRLPLPVLKVKFQTDRNILFAAGQGARVTDQYYRNDVFRIAGGERITRSLSYTAGKRGYYSIDNIDLVASDLFMTREMVSSLPVRCTLYVFPRPSASRELRQSLQQLNGEILTRRHLIEDPFEYRGIREYQPYDDLRSINWKATAKTGELKVNQKNYTALQSVRIFLNLEDNGVLKKSDCVEEAIRAAAGIAEFFLCQGIRVACYTNGPDLVERTPFALEASAGNAQLSAVYHGLARIDADGEVPTFVPLWRDTLLNGARGTFTFLISPNMYDDFIGLAREYGDLGEPFVWFVPVWETKDPDVPEGLDGRVRFIHFRN